LIVVVIVVIVGVVPSIVGATVLIAVVRSDIVVVTVPTTPVPHCITVDPPPCCRYGCVLQACGSPYVGHDDRSSHTPPITPPLPV